MDNGAFSGIFLQCSKFDLPEKNLKNKDFASLTQIFKPLTWVPKIIKTYITVR